MKKGIVILALIIMALFSVSCIYAADVNDTLAASEDTGEIELSHEMESTDNNLKTSEEQIVTQTDNEEKMGDTDDGTFEALYYNISCASSGDTIYLKNNYSCEDSWTREDGIYISISNLVIDGNGYTIDAKGKTRIFKIYQADNVTIKNITFINAKVNGDGGAIIWSNCYGCSVSDCSFVNCSANRGGGAIGWYHSDGGNVSGCSFVNCSTVDSGGAIGWYYSDGGNVSGCSFVNCSADRGGGAIYWSNSANGIISDCIFINVTASSGKAIRIEYGSSASLDRNWFGNTAKNYKSSPTAYIKGASTDNWLFLNATVNPESISTEQTADIIFKLYLYNNTGITDYTSLAKVDLALNSNGKLDKNVTGLDEKVTFTPTSIGTGNITATIENVAYTTTLTVMPDNTFWALNQTINANNKTEINLTNDYYYDSAYDYDFTEGIKITRQITINGNGYTIDAKGKARVFYFEASDVSIENLNIENANVNGDGGAIYFSDSGCVINCNFTNNSASNCGGAIYFSDSGSVHTVTNCNFTGNKATSSGSYGGAILFVSTGTVTNCNFINNTAEYNSGAVYFWEDGEVTNCNFINNTATDGDIGALCIKSGTVTNCNFTNNSASKECGALYMNSGTVTNCNFTNNSASRDGGALYMYYVTVTNSKFTNNVGNRGGAILSFYWWSVTADTCIFKNDSDSTYQVHILPPTLNVDNFTTFYGSGEKLTFNLTTNSSMPVYNGNISISVYYKNNGSWVGNYSYLSGEGWTVDLPVGSYYAIFNTEYAEFKAINRTITIFPNNTFWALNHIINNNDNDTITLNMNYTYDPEVDSSCISIQRPVTIIGNNYTLNGKGQTGIISISNTDNVTIKDITFINGRYVSGAAIYCWNCNNISVIGCNFINNTADDSYSDGGAIHLQNTVNSNVVGCRFVDNRAEGYGGAIYCQNGAVYVSESIFANNNASIGAAISWGSSAYGGVFGCIFINNYANHDYSGVLHYGNLDDSDNNLTVKNNVFLNNPTIPINRESNKAHLISDYNWFGANTTNYADNPNVFGCNVWLFLNATADPNAIAVSGASNVTFQLYAYDSTSGNITKYDYTPFRNLNLTITATNGNVSKNITKLDEPVTYTATSMGTGSITASIENVTYTIEITNLGLNPDLSFDSQEADYGTGTIIALNYNATATGTVNITLKGKNGNNYTFKNLALNATIQLPEAINADEYEANVTYSGDNVFLNATATGKLTINKADSTLTINDNVAFDYNTNGSTTVSFTNASGVNASVIGQPNAIVVVNDTTITVSGLDAGNYTLSVTTITDENHNNVTKTANITVNKIDSTLSVSDVTLDYGTPANVTATTEGTTGITAKINDKEAAVENNVIIIPVLDAGTYTLTVTTITDANHNPVTKTATITVNKLKTQLTAKAITTTYNADKKLVITLKDTTGKAVSGVKVTVKLKGTKTYTTDKNGQVKISTKALAPKKYTAKITFSGNKNYDKSAKDVKVTVKKAKAKIFAKKKTYKAKKKTKKFKIKLKDKNGKAIKKAKVRLIVKKIKKTSKSKSKKDKKKYKKNIKKTNKKGKITFKIKRNKKGKYKGTIKFYGNKYYKKAVKTVKIKMK